MFESIKTKLQAWGRALKARDQVTFDDEGVTRTRRDGLVEYVGWDELLSVDIATTNEGHWFDDVFWLLSAGDHGCVVPSEAEGMGDLLLRLQELPGFDDEAVIRAMNCTDNEPFPVWSREAGEYEEILARNAVEHATALDLTERLLREHPVRTHRENQFRWISQLPSSADTRAFPLSSL